MKRSFSAAAAAWLALSCDGLSVTNPMSTAGKHAHRTAHQSHSSRAAAVQQTATSEEAGAGNGLRPPTLPAGEFRPKQSLGQNFLSDQNYVMKICNSFRDNSEGGRGVVELGPGAGALTQVSAIASVR
jgi:Ribosomal RNA adenine dimethylase